MQKKSVIVIGDTGAGKSWLLNCLFCPSNIDIQSTNRPIIFNESEGIDSATQEITTRSIAVNINDFSFELEATDTPGFSDSNLNGEAHLNSIMSTIRDRECIIIFVIQFERFKESIQRALEALKECFSGSLTIDSKIFVVNKVSDSRDNEHMKRECNLLLSRVLNSLSIDQRETFTIRFEKV